MKSTFKFMHIKLYIKRLTKILSDCAALEIKLSHITMPLIKSVIDEILNDK